MRKLSFCIAMLLFVFQAPCATASITFSTIVTPGSVVGNQQSFSVKLGLAGTNDSVSSFGFTATLSTQSGPAISLVNVGGFTITSPDVPNSPGFGSSFQQNTSASSTGNSITFTGIPGTGSFIFVNSTTDQFRQIDFTVNILATQNLAVTLASAPTGDPAQPTANGFVNNVGANVSANFGTPLAAGSITAVPEPTSIALLAFGGGFAFIARFRIRRTEKKK